MYKYQKNMPLNIWFSALSCDCHEMGWAWPAVYNLVWGHSIFFQRHSFSLSSTLSYTVASFWNCCLKESVLKSITSVAFDLQSSWIKLPTSLHSSWGWPPHTWRRAIRSCGSADTFLPHLPNAQNNNNSICGIARPKMLLNCRHFFNCDWR